MNTCLRFKPEIDISPEINIAPKIKIIPENSPTLLSGIYGGKITAYDEKRHCWIIDGCFAARCATSLLVKPTLGDKVTFVEMDDNFYITQLLAQKVSDQELLIESQQPVHWVAPVLRFTAWQELDLISLNRLSLMSKSCMMSVANSLIQQTQNLVQQVGQFSLTAKGLLRLNGKQQVITAEEDVRIDGKRINMG